MEHTHYTYLAQRQDKLDGSWCSDGLCAGESGLDSQDGQDFKLHGVVLN